MVVLREKIIESTAEIFSTMVMMEVTVEDESPPAGRPLIDTISGIIGLAGTYKGVLAIHLPNPVALAITASFLGLEVDEINEDVEDAVGELANMLGGSVKSILSEKGRDIDLSLPTTIAGKDYHFQPTKEGEMILTSFACDAGTFTVELQLER
jgi:chemotaxis protein CheX